MKLLYKRILITGLSFLIAIMPCLAHADIIYFKSGEKVKGEVTAESKRSIMFQLTDGSFKTYHLVDIERVEEGEVVIAVPVEEGPVSTEAVAKRETTYLKINPMVELDFKTKDEIYAIRKKYVAQYPELLGKIYKNLGANIMNKLFSFLKLKKGESDVNVAYEPSYPVFGQIKSGKAWWGILGMSYYGPGNKSIAGPSEESRYIANPYMLVGIVESNSYVVKGGGRSPKIMYPKPYSLQWKSNGTFGQVSYNISAYWGLQRNYHFKGNKHTEKFSLCAYNARDLGYGYCFIDMMDSMNIRPLKVMDEPFRIRHYLHCGGSCGYRGGCNNMSPRTPELDIKIQRLPARVTLKLWRDLPKTSSQPADIVFNVKLT